MFVACFRQDIARFAVQSEQLGTIPVTYSGFTRFHGCSVRLHYALGLALAKSPYDTHLALPVRLPLYHRLNSYLEKLTVSFSSLNYYLISDGVIVMVGGWLLSTYVIAEFLEQFCPLRNRRSGRFFVCLL